MSDARGNIAALLAAWYGETVPDEIVDEVMTAAGLNRANQRGESVTVEEMTRRRDGWRQRYDQKCRELIAARAHSKSLTKQLMAAEMTHAACGATTQRLRVELEASRAEARRFATECGRLRDQLAERS